MAENNKLNIDNGGIGIQDSSGVNIDQRKYELHTSKLTFESLPFKDRKRIHDDFFYRLNREVQEREFNMFLDEQVEFEKPFLFFVHGFRDDEHVGITKRLSNITARFFETNTVELDLGSWTEAIENDEKVLVYNFKHKLSKAVETFISEKQSVKHQIPKAFKKCDFLFEIPVLKDSGIMLQLNVYAKYWHKKIIEVLKNQIVNQLLGISLPNSKKPLFLFIHLVYEPPKKRIKSLFGGNINEKIEKELTAFYNENKDNCFLFKQLSKIEYPHVDTFMSKGDYAMMKASDYIKEDEALSFDEFWSRIKDHVAQFYFKSINDVL